MRPVPVSVGNFQIGPAIGAVSKKHSRYKLFTPDSRTYSEALSS